MIVSGEKPWYHNWVSLVETQLFLGVGGVWVVNVGGVCVWPHMFTLEIKPSSHKKTLVTATLTYIPI